MFEYLDKLNEEQKKAATHIDGPLLIIAGAGSGKTTTLINRVAYMVDRGIAPESILLLTFTNAAADNMKKRASKLSDPNCKKITASTYHSFCAENVRKYAPFVGVNKDFVIMTPNEELEAFKLCKSELGYGKFRDFPQSKEVMEVVSGCLNKMEDVYSVLETILKEKGEVIKDAVKKVVKRLVEYKKDNNLMSYDDLLVKMEELLRNEDIRDILEEHYQYIMVDEYQDTNKLQEKIVFALTREKKNLVVVGDDYQCWHKDSVVITRDGVKKIKDLNIGDEVQTILKGKVDFSKVTNKSHHLAKTIKITTESGKEIKVTREHKMFASQPDFSEGHYVYLMYRKDKGFRIGITTGGKTKNVGIRTQFERAEKLWFLGRYETKYEAHYYENKFSLEYQIPQVPFYSNGRDLKIRQDEIDKIFQEFGQNGFKLLEDFGMLFEYPNFMPQGTVRGLESKKNVYLQMDASHKTNNVSYESEGVRVRKYFNSYKDALFFANELVEKYNANFIERLFIENRTFLKTIPASNLTPTMMIPVEDNGVIKLEKIVDISDSSDELSEVYHIEVSQTGILIANKIASHNCIYSFRAADINNIIDFPEKIGGCRQIVIDKNYRSSKEILDVANEIMDAYADFGYPKIMKDNGKSNKKVTFVKPGKCDEEAELIFESIKKWRDDGNNLSEYAVLERKSKSSSLLEVKLSKEGIEYEKLGGLKFLEHQCIVDMLAIFRVISNPSDELSWFHLLDILPGIGETYAHKVMSDLKQGVLDKGDSPWKTKRFYKDLVNLRAFIEDMRDSSEFEDIFDKSKDYYVGIRNAKIENMICKKEESRELERVQLEDDMETIGILKDIAMEYDDVIAFLDSIVLDSNVEIPIEGKVIISTIHSAKGLEWEHVDLMDCMDDIFPIKSGTKFEKMEDLRCLYVALTRAKDEEVIYAPNFAMICGKEYNKVSPFLTTCFEKNLFKVDANTNVHLRNGGKKVYLNVNFHEKETAKSYGARWDSLLRCWFIPEDHKNAPILIRIFGQAIIR